MNVRNKARLKIASVVVLAVVAALIAYPGQTHIKWVDFVTEKLQINLGLDLQGGVHLVYQAEMENIKKENRPQALEGLQDVIEKRVNAYGVAEPVVQTSTTGGQSRLIVELAGIKDIEEAKNMIKETPILVFKEEEGKAELTEEQRNQIEESNQQAKEKAEEALKKAKEGRDFGELVKEYSDDEETKESEGELGYIEKGGMFSDQNQIEEAIFSEEFEKGEVYSEMLEGNSGYHIIKKIDEKNEEGERQVKIAQIVLRTTDPEMLQNLMGPNFEQTKLTGQFLENSQVVFNPNTNMPQVSLKFNDEGTELFKEITERNVGERIAIYLDGQQITAPVVQDVIRNGEAVINGDFGLDEAKELSQRLNSGALPVPITLISQQSVEASLGKASLEKSLKAGAIGLLAVAIFMVLYYRLAGLVAVVALAIYTALMVSIFKLSSITPLSITLTLSGIAGFILSIGMAVDANILIFERIKEEIRKGRDLKASLKEGFRRAWPSIRDGNYSTIITALILIMLGTGFIKGFAITLVIGVVLSMFTAIVITKILLNSVFVSWFEKHKKFVIIGTEENKN